MIMLKKIQPTFWYGISVPLFGVYNFSNNYDNVNNPLLAGATNMECSKGFAPG